MKEFDEAIENDNSFVYSNGNKSSKGEIENDRAENCENSAESICHNKEEPEVKAGNTDEKKKTVESEEAYSAEKETATGSENEGVLTDSAPQYFSSYLYNLVI